ncbi:MAG: HAD hydrolase-like protein [Acidobacteriia bacterium]|nr:HAD hydrolase-like protein [Terriglobia bacterium]
MHTRQNLIFDADDTLWENNIYYEQIRETFLGLTDALGVPRAEVEKYIDDTERKNIRLHGYGSENFVRSLKETYRHFAADRDPLEDTLDQIHDFGPALSDFEIDFLPGVPDTLQTLHGRHRLFLLTKGAADEQRGKVQRSNLSHLFEGVHVVAEKDPSVYEELVQSLGLDKAHTWMIGNSPRSDINPALAAGLGAVYVPHPVTWHFEKVPVLEHSDRLITIEKFPDLLNHF